jgi:hypothetical protein
MPDASNPQKVVVYVGNVLDFDRAREIAAGDNQSLEPLPFQDSKPDKLS